MSCIILLIMVLFMLAAGAKVTILINETTETSADKFSINNYVLEQGYPIEVHQDVETEDGYLLDIHRIPYGISGNDSGRRRPVVFLMHGLGGSADCWVITGPQTSLAFLLADRGYDVWIGNARGTSHSKKHVYLNPKEDTEYWDFSWHEIGYYDIPATFNYILKNVTNEEQLFYIGHSQGGTTYFVATSSRPELNKMIRLMIGLAPGMFYGSILNIIPNEDTAGLLFGQIENTRRLLKINEIGPQVRDIGCKSPLFRKEICDGLIFSVTGLAGLDITQLNFDEIELLKQIMPDSASARQFLHYLQLILTATFKQYDFGKKVNLRKYGTSRPPLYDLENSTAPVAIFSATGDIVVPIFYLKNLCRRIPNLALDYTVPYVLFSHLDYIIAKDVVELLYNKVFDIMERYSSVE